MVRENRTKVYYFPGSPYLYGDASTGELDIFAENPINGRIQSIYFEGGNWNPAGSIMISISGTSNGLTATEGEILTMTSGTATGHHLGEDWVVFPRATTVTTAGVPISGADGYAEFAEIPVYSTMRVQAGIVGTGSNASGLTIVYI